MTRLACSIEIAGRAVCSITSTAGWPGTYTNATASFTFPTTSRALTIANGSGTTCPLGTGALQVTTWNWTVTSAPGPVIGP